jgi:hypothetical protein
MTKSAIGKVRGPKGDILIFSDGFVFNVGYGWNGLTVNSEKLEIVDGKKYIDISALRIGNDFQRVELTSAMLAKHEEIVAENALATRPLGSIITSRGKIIISLTKDGKIFIRYGDKTAIIDSILKVKGLPVIEIDELDIGLFYLAVPNNILKVYQELALERTMRSLHLVFKGVCPVTFKTFYGFNCEVPYEIFSKVKPYFEEFSYGDMKGKLTSDPDFVEKILQIRRNTIAERKTEIEAEKEAYMQKQENIFKTLNAIKRAFVDAELSDSEPGKGDVIKHPYNEKESWVIEKNTSGTQESRKAEKFVRKFLPMMGQQSYLESYRYRTRKFKIK